MGEESMTVSRARAVVRKQGIGRASEFAITKL